MEKLLRRLEGRLSSAHVNDSIFLSSKTLSAEQEKLNTLIH